MCSRTLVKMWSHFEVIKGQRWRFPRILQCPLWHLKPLTGVGLKQDTGNFRLPPVVFTDNISLLSLTSKSSRWDGSGDTRILAEIREIKLICLLVLRSTGYSQIDGSFELFLCRESESKQYILLYERSASRWLGFIWGSRIYSAIKWCVSSSEGSDPRGERGHPVAAFISHS